MAEAQEVMPLQTGVDDRTDEPLYDDVVLGLTKKCHSCSKIKGMELSKVTVRLCVQPSICELKYYSKTVDSAPPPLTLAVSLLY